MPDEPEVPTKQPYEIAIDEFEEADKDYRQAEEFLTSGDAVAELVRLYGNDEMMLRQQWMMLWAQLRQKLDDRNAKYTEAANRLRQTVIPDVSKGATWRGINGKAARTRYGSMEVCSRTKRFFKGEELYNLAERYNLLGELERLTYLDEKTGERQPVLQSVILVNFKHMLDWLRDHDHGGTPEEPTVYKKILDGSYEEKEDTPAVSGAKKIAFLGQKVD